MRLEEVVEEEERLLLEQEKQESRLAEIRRRLLSLEAERAVEEARVWKEPKDLLAAEVPFVAGRLVYKAFVRSMLETPMARGEAAMLLRDAVTKEVYGGFRLDVVEHIGSRVRVRLEMLGAIRESRVTDHIVYAFDTETVLPLVYRAARWPVILFGMKDRAMDVTAIASGETCESRARDMHDVWALVIGWLERVLGGTILP